MLVIIEEKLLLPTKLLTTFFPYFLKIYHQISIILYLRYPINEKLRTKHQKGAQIELTLSQQGM